MLHILVIEVSIYHFEQFISSHADFFKDFSFLLYPYNFSLICAVNTKLSCSVGYTDECISLSSYHFKNWDFKAKHILTD